MKKTLRDLEPEILNKIQELGISTTTLSKRMYPNQPEKAVISRLKGKFFGTGNMTDEDIILLKDALFSLSTDIAACATTLEKRINRKRKIQVLNLTDEEIAAIEQMRSKK